MLQEGEIILYHGTSTKDIEKVLEIGYPAAKGNSKYDEVIPIMSKYIRPEILTPDFFERYWDAMNQVFYFAGNPIYRIRQFDGVGRGIFAVSCRRGGRALPGRREYRRQLHFQDRAGPDHARGSEGADQRASAGECRSQKKPGRYESAVRGECGTEIAS